MATTALAVEVPAVAEVRSAVHGAEEGRDVVVGDLLALPDGHVRPALHVVVRVHGVPAQLKSRKGCLWVLNTQHSEENCLDKIFQSHLVLEMQLCDMSAVSGKTPLPLPRPATSKAFTSSSPIMN